MRKNRLREYFNSELMTRLFIPVTTILVSLVCFTLTTWAWYTASVSTGVNSITAATTFTNVSATSDPPVNTYNMSEEDNQTEFTPINVEIIEGQSQLLPGNQTYLFRLQNDGDSKSGYYCVLTFTATDNSEVKEYHTQNFGTQTETGNELIFIVTLNKESYITCHTNWGNPPENTEIIRYEDNIEVFEAPVIEESREVEPTEENEEQQKSSEVESQDNQSETVQEQETENIEASEETESQNNEQNIIDQPEEITANTAEKDPALSEEPAPHSETEDQTEVLLTETGNNESNTPDITSVITDTTQTEK